MPADPSPPLAPPSDWPPGVRDVYSGLQTYRIVGASACVEAITQALGVLACAVATRPGGDVYGALAQAGTLFCALKPNTAAYVNAVQWITSDLHAESGPADHLAAVIMQRIDAYRRYKQKSLERIAEEGTNLLAPGCRVLLHDYSSTVLAVLAEAGRRGQHLQGVVTAGQPVDRGPHVAALVASYGHGVTFIPDTSVGRVMTEIDVVLTGVETLYRNGDLVNTVGTYPIALVARECGVPVYGVTECLKIHPTATGVRAADLTACLLHTWPDAAVTLPVGTRTRSEVLDLTPAHLVTGYVTDAGILAPQHMEVALQWLRSHHEAIGRPSEEAHRESQQRAVQKSDGGIEVRDVGASQ